MIKVVCVGKIKENYLVDGIKEYLKRIEGFQKIEVVEVKEYNLSDISKNIDNEGENILEKITKDDLPTYGNSKITFVIGGSNGISEKVKKRSNYQLSFSDMTFPHQLMRLILLEQIYRALTIINHKEYHK